MSAPDERLPACRCLLFPLGDVWAQARSAFTSLLLFQHPGGGGGLRWETCLGAAVIKDALEQALAYTRLFCTLF